MIEDLLHTVLLTSIPLMLAAIGELVSERGGVLNLGVEGMMLMGAVTGFGITALTGNPYIGILGGAMAGAATAAVFGFFVLGLYTNQVATGLALTIFATGLSGLIGAPLVGSTVEGINPLVIPGLAEIPVLGAFFRLDAIAYLAVAVIVAVSYMLTRTRMGLILRAVGANHDSAHALGYSVVGVRFAAVLFGGAMAGLAGGYLPLVLTPHWSEGMTAGRGWIALALVVFASWIPWRVAVGALLFGGVTIMQLAGQAQGWTTPAQFLSMLPYLATILVLVLVSAWGKVYFGAPAHLGVNFHASR